MGSFSRLGQKVNMAVGVSLTVVVILALGEFDPTATCINLVTS